MSQPPDTPPEGRPKAPTGEVPGSPPRRGRRPSAGAKEARAELAEARERKKAGRRTERVGAVLASYGIDTPEQAERLMAALLDPKRAGWRRFIADELKARPTDRWPPA